MANNYVTLVHSDGTYVPSLASVPVVNGDTVSFSTDDGSSALAYFSADAVAVLSPTPGNPSIIGPGGQSEFSFTSSNPGAYSVYFAPQGSPAPATYPVAASQNLLLEFEVPNQPPFSGPGDNPGTGH